MIKSGICWQGSADTAGNNASIGLRMLNFKADKNGNLHSQFLMWQAVGGYNNAYDAIFRTYTNENMRREKFPFTIDKTEYILWIWRGDYLNLGAGAEIGIYSRPTWLSGAVPSLDHYFVDFSLAMPMTLNLYNYNGEKDIDSIYNWAPDNEQWWITGFNPECVGNVDVKKQVIIGTVDFTGNEEMYEEFVNSINDLKKANDKKAQYIITDEENLTIWLCWYEWTNI